MKKKTSKTPKKKCGDLKAKVRELRKDARAAMEKKESATKKYKKKLKKLVAELEPFKAAAMDAKKTFRKKKKAYLKGKEKLDACLNPKSKVEKPKQDKKVTKKAAKPKAKKAQRVKPVAKREPADVSKKTTTKRAPYAVPSVAAKAEKTPSQAAKKTPVNPRKTAVKPTRRRTSSGKDNLKRIEGIGPKIESLLNADGITTFVQLSKAKIDRLQKVLDNAGPRFRMHKPTTWAEQAGIAASGDWAQLKQLQDVLKGGRRE